MRAGTGFGLIPTRLKGRGGRKLIITPEGVTVPTPKPRRDAGQGPRPGPPMATADRERSVQVDHRPCGAGRRDGRVRLPAPATHLPRAGQGRSDPRRAAAEGLRLWCAAAWHSARLGGAPL